MFNKLSIESLVSIARNYGPFFFAVILIFYLLKKTKKDYTESCTRDEPKASQEEINTNRKIYVATSIITALFIFICSGLWLFFKFYSKEYVYHFRLMDISEYETLAIREDPIFVKKNPQGQGELSIQRYAFDYILLSNKELSESDMIFINYVNFEKEGERIEGLIELNPSKMSGNSYRISKTNGKIDKDGQIIRLKFEGTILASTNPSIVDYTAKRKLSKYSYAYNSRDSIYY